MTAVRTRSRPRSAPSRPAAPRPAARSRAAAPARSTKPAKPATSTSSRAAVRSLPQETTGPRLRVHLRRRVSPRTLLAASAALFFLVLAGSVTIQAQRIEAQHRIDQLDAQLLAAEQHQRELRADVALAESPERIMGAAVDLGMVEPGPVLPLVPASPDATDQRRSEVEGADGQGGGPVALGSTSEASSQVPSDGD